MGNLSAYCGLRCDACPIRLASIEKDEERQYAMRVSISKQCNTLYGLTLQPEDIGDCDGCRAKTNRKFPTCKQCEIRTCAIGKHIQNCASCLNYGCEKLQAHFCFDPATLSILEESQKPF